MQSRRDVAFEFYKSKGMPEGRIDGHLNGIDFRHPVEVATIPKGSVVEQFQVQGGKQGSYYSEGGVTPTELGINPRGEVLGPDGKVLHGPDGQPIVADKVVTRWIVTEDTQALKTRAGAIDDTWSVSGEPAYSTSGGATQYDSPERTHFQQLPPAHGEPGTASGPHTPPGGAGGDGPGHAPPGGDGPGHAPPGGEGPGHAPPGGEGPGHAPPGGEGPGHAPPGGEGPGHAPPGGDGPGHTPPGGGDGGGPPSGGHEPPSGGHEPPGNGHESGQTGPERGPDGRPLRDAGNKVSPSGDGFRLNRKNIQHYEKIVGQPESVVRADANREALAAELAASKPQVEKVYLGHEADQLINHSQGRGLSADVVAVNKRGQFLVYEAKGMNIEHGLEQLEHTSQQLGSGRVARQTLVVPERINTPGYTVVNGVLHSGGGPVMVDGKPVHVIFTHQR
jgi:hypothetical protein